MSVEIVKQVYVDFGSGNIPGVLAALTEDIQWQEPPHGVPPFAGLHSGLAAVGQFFQQLGANCEVLAFEPREFFSSGNRVVALGWYRFRARPTGKTWDTSWAMTFTFRDGKIAAFEVIKDSAAEVAAFSA